MRSKMPTINEQVEPEELELLEREDDDMEPEMPAVPVQDLHAMLDVFLSSYKKVQDRGGFLWDLRYQGKTRRCQFVPYCMFIKGDSVEHDKHCGHYTCRTKGVKQICRYCHANADDLDQAYLHFFERRKPEEIQKLIDARDL